MMTSFRLGAGYWKLVIEKQERRRNPKSAIRNPQSEIRNPQSMRRPKSSSLTSLRRRNIFPTSLE
jgi:hypothetical protein